MKAIILSFLLTLVFCLTNQVQNGQHPAFELPAGYSEEIDLVYSNLGSPQKLDIYYMKEADQPMPLVVWIHGGAWRGGDKRHAQFARQLLGHGYAVASINYRLSGQAIFPAQIIDCKAAVRWLRAHAREYNLDSQKFAAWGGSAGGHLAALLGTAEEMPEWEKGDYLEYSSRVQAVIDWYGPTDFSRMNDQPGRHDHLAAGSPESDLIGCTVKENPDKVAYANPITYIRDYNPPFQILHGKDDKVVIPSQAALLNEAFLMIGKTPDFALVENTAHAGKKWNLQVPRAKEFLDKHLLDNNDRPKPSADSIRGQKRWTNTYFALPQHLTYVRFYSHTIGQDYGYMVYLPPSYQHNQHQRYPTIYWLPGRGGNPRESDRFVSMYHDGIRADKTPEAIIISVTGVNSSMYTNDKSGAYPIESVIIDDLIPHVDSIYRTIQSADKRAIDGFSMGGYGAARLGFKYPDLFGVVSIIGGALHRPKTIITFRNEIFKSVFDSDLQYVEETSPWTLVRDNVETIKSEQMIRQYIGAGDPNLFEKNKDFHQLMKALGIDHEFEIVPNARHNYQQVFENMDGDPFSIYRTAFN